MAPGQLSLTYESISPHATLSFGKSIGREAEAGTVVALIGPLGAGKTQLVKGIAMGLGVADPRKVCSPTFVIVREHEGRLHLYHVDTYRVSPAEIEAIGFDEMCKAEGIVVIEWADRMVESLPDDRLTITIEPTGAQARRLSCTASGLLSRGLLRQLERAARSSAPRDATHIDDV